VSRKISHHITESNYVKYAGSITSAYAIDTILSCVIIFHRITNHFIGEEFCLDQTSTNGYKAMGFDVTQLTQDEEQSLFTIKTNMPIPMLVYGDFSSGKNMVITFYHQI
jgi:hypothetical protein